MAAGRSVSKIFAIAATVVAAVAVGATITVALLSAFVFDRFDGHGQVPARVHAEGGYRIKADGPVGGYIQPRLAFGDTGSMDPLILVFAAVAFLACDVAVAAWWLRRSRSQPVTPNVSVVAGSADPFVPSDEGVRLEQLKTIAALKDSGALSESEFEAEKRRILRGE